MNLWPWINTAFAQIQGTQPISISNPLAPCNDLTCISQSIINFLFTLAIPICAIMVLIGGFQMLTAAGNPEKFSSGRKTIMYAAVGFAVIVIADGVALLIKNILTGG
ncbi:MAG: hypothetical protein KGJ13_00675 [Patescibacteria group bacterium]|nr:hypothetical protein [Patescibacteria group bacterium]